jgi:monothiol glutaredoxin
LDEEEVMSKSIEEEIKQDISNSKVLVYMKGTPQAPQCGFSAATVQLLGSFGVPLETRDVIANPELREKVPSISNWPTFPQIFVNGKLIGGCDIVHEMHERGELEPLVKAAVK